MIDRRTFLQSAAATGAAASLPSAGLAAPASDTLDAIARSRGLRFGTAVSADHLDNALLAKTIERECGVLVAENEFKWKHLEPAEGKYRTEGAKRIESFAAAHDMLLRGHTFAWSQDNRIPDWLLKQETALSTNSGEALIAAMWKHCNFLADTFPAVTSWDAVNEAVQLQDGKLRSSLLTRALGEQFIDVAFAMMRRRMPKAQMVYNDYMSWDRKPDHRDGVLRMLERALGRGVKIDALGIQSHLGGNLGKQRDELAWRKFLEAVEGMGLKVLITELDCSDRNVASKDVAARDAETAAYVKGYLDLTLSFTNVQQVLTWSLSDFDTYVNRNGYPQDRRRPDGLDMRAHPYDVAIAEKPMRAAIAAALAAAPKRGVSA